MSITVAFLGVVAAVLLGGTGYRHWDASRHLRFADEAGTGAATMTLARFEAAKVLTHPTWLVTLAVVGGLTTTLVLMETNGSVPSEAPAIFFALLAIPVAGLALVVSLHRIGTRSRRHGTEELEAVMPTAPRARTAALLLSCLAPLPVLVVALGVGIAVSQMAYAWSPAPTPSNLLPSTGFLLAGVGGAVVGVMLSRWLPFLVAPLLGIAAIIWLNNGVDARDPRLRWLRVAVEADYGGRFDITPHGWSAVFTVGLIGLGACLALLAHPVRPPLVAATVACVLVVVSAGWVMTRAPSAAEVAEVVDMLEDPTAHQSCGSRAEVTFCVYPGAEGWVDAWVPAVREVLAQVPAAARPARVEIVQRTRVDPTRYLPEVRAALNPATAWPADGRIHPPLSIESELYPDMTVAWQAAALAVGLPPATDWAHPAGCMAGGQARITLAHLLAARATPSTAAALRSKSTHATTAGAGQPVPMDLEYDYGPESPQPEGAEVDPADLVAADGASTREYLATVGASGWGSDMLAALALLDADRGTVDRAIASHWDELVDPATPTARFLELAGLGGGRAPAMRTETSEAAACP